jgi:hypothetical protein
MTKITTDNGLFTTDIIVGNDMVLIQREDNMTKHSKQMLFHLSEWDEIDKIINENRTDRKN